MVFSSIPFLCYFLPLFLLVYFASPRKARNFVLLVFSLIFYAWGEPVYISLLLVSSVVDYVNGRCLERFEGQRGKQRIFLIISLVVNLSLLGVFKYATLFITTSNSLFGTGFKDPALALPLGISFFTFQTMSYSMDVYMGNVKAEHNFIDYMAYVSMFPQLVAGPIVRYEEVSIELKNRKETLAGFTSGMQRFLFGIFKKVLIANQMSRLWDTISAMPDRSVMMAWLGALAFTFRIYFDFSGYSDMAIGLGKIMGFNYPENFNYPYTCTSITDFWRRWHMTLSGWFRDYVYIPLGGNRKGMARQIFNIGVVWALTGFWHGASWNYLLWGLYYFVILLIEKLSKGKFPGILPTWLARIYSLFVVMVGWIIFAVEDFKQLGKYLADAFIFGANGFVGHEALYQLRNYILVFAVCILFSMPISRKIAAYGEKNEKAGNVIAVFGTAATMLLTVVSLAMLVADSYNPFLYFRF